MGDRNNMELEPKWNRVVKVWWAYVLRRIGVTLLITIPVGVILVWLIPESQRTDEAALNLLLFPFTIAAGILISLLPMKWIIGKNFGEFRLILQEVPKDHAVKAKADPVQTLWQNVKEPLNERVRINETRINQVRKANHDLIKV